MDCADSTGDGNGCNGGNPGRAFEFLSTYSVPSEEQYPYMSGEDGEARGCSASQTSQPVIDTTNYDSYYMASGANELMNVRPLLAPST